MIKKKNVNWSILTSVQNFLIGEENDVDTLPTMLNSMTEALLGLCALQSEFGIDTITQGKISNIISSCSDVYEFLKRVDQEMDEVVNS